MQVSTFGIMPPEIVPSAIKRCASLTDNSLIRFLSLSSTPGTSVRNKSRDALPVRQGQIEQNHLDGGFAKPDKGRRKLHHPINLV